MDALTSMNKPTMAAEHDHDRECHLSVAVAVQTAVQIPEGEAGLLVAYRCSEALGSALNKSSPVGSQWSEFKRSPAISHLPVFVTRVSVYVPADFRFLLKSTLSGIHIHRVGHNSSTGFEESEAEADIRSSTFIAQAPATVVLSVWRWTTGTIWPQYRTLTMVPLLLAFVHTDKGELRCQSCGIPLVVLYSHHTNTNTASAPPPPSPYLTSRPPISFSPSPSLPPPSTSPSSPPHRRPQHVAVAPVFVHIFVFFWPFPAHFRSLATQLPSIVQRLRVQSASAPGFRRIRALLLVARWPDGVRVGRMSSSRLPINTFRISRFACYNSHPASHISHLSAHDVEDTDY